MGMFDNVKCEYPLPDAPHVVQKEVFQTKSFGDGFTGGFMDDYTVTKDGKLIWNKKTYEYVEEEDRPYYGKSEWEKHGLYRLMGSLRSVHEEDIEKDFHGVLNIYTEVGRVWYEYNIEFTNGKVSRIIQINREFGV